MNKLPQITLAFWVMKICATTLGETAGDLLSMTLDVGYALSSLILISMFVATLSGQLSAKRYHPALYWLVILSTSTAGTTMSDFMDRTLEVGYAGGSAMLIAVLLAVFAAWYRSEGSLSVNRITTRQGELFYWFAILFSNTLGTALGDFLADDSGLGFAGGALLVGSALAGVVLLRLLTRISSVLLFWVAFVLTRPFGATLGDVLTKPYEKGGLGFGTVGSSTVLLGVLVVLVAIATIRNTKPCQLDCLPNRPLPSRGIKCHRRLTGRLTGEPVQTKAPCSGCSNLNTINEARGAFEAPFQATSLPAPCPPGR